MIVEAQPHRDQDERLSHGLAFACVVAFFGLLLIGVGFFIGSHERASVCVETER